MDPDKKEVGFEATQPFDKYIESESEAGLLPVSKSDMPSLEQTQTKNDELPDIWEELYE